MPTGIYRAGSAQSSRPAIPRDVWLVNLNGPGYFQTDERASVQHDHLYNGSGGTTVKLNIVSRRLMHRSPALGVRDDLIQSEGARLDISQDLFLSQGHLHFGDKRPFAGQEERRRISHRSGVRFKEQPCPTTAVGLRDDHPSDCTCVVCDQRRQWRVPSGTRHPATGTCTACRDSREHQHGKRTATW